MTPEDRSEFNVWLKLPLGSTVQQTQAATRVLEAELRRRPEVRAVFTTIGGGLKKRVNEALVYVQLVPKSGSRPQASRRSWRSARRASRELGLPVERLSRSRRCR